MSAPRGSKRRRIVVIGVVVLLLTILLTPWCGPPPLVTGAYVQAVTQDRAVIVIVGDAARARGVRAERDGDAPRGVAALEVPATRMELRHEFALEGLSPGRRYDFEVFEPQGLVIASGHFRTRSDDPERRVEFAVVGDSGGLPSWIWMQATPLFRMVSADDWLPPAATPRAIGAAIAASEPDFWMHVGDVVYPKGGPEHFRMGFFEPFAEALRTSVCYPLLGNHDVMTDDGAPFLANFVLPSGGDERFFTFVDGPLRVIGLDLNPPVGADHPGIVFLRQTLEAADEKWIVVANHFPIRSAYREEPRTDLEQHYVPLCKQHGVDLLLSGHDHNYQRFGSPGAGDGPIELVTGGGGKSLYDLRFSPPGLMVAERAYHFTKITVEPARLHVRAIALDGRVLDDFTLTK